MKHTRTNTHLLNASRPATSHAVCCSLPTLAALLASQLALGCAASEDAPNVEPAQLAVDILQGSSGPVYRRMVTVDNRGGPLQNYPVLLTTDLRDLVAAGTVEPDCSNLMFSDAELRVRYPFAVEDRNCDDPTVRLWVMPQALRPGANRLSLLYGGTPQSAGPDHPATIFPLHEDFNTATLDTDKWQPLPASTYTMDGDSIRFVASSYFLFEGLRTAQSFGPGYALVYKARYHGNAYGDDGSLDHFSWGDRNGAFSGFIEVGADLNGAFQGPYLDDSEYVGFLNDNHHDCHLDGSTEWLMCAQQSGGTDISSLSTGVEFHQDVRAHIARYPGKTVLSAETNGDESFSILYDGSGAEMNGVISAFHEGSSGSPGKLDIDWAIVRPAVMPEPTAGALGAEGRVTRLRYGGQGGTSWLHTVELADSGRMTAGTFWVNDQLSPGSAIIEPDVIMPNSCVEKNMAGLWLVNGSPWNATLSYCRGADDQLTISHINNDFPENAQTHGIVTF